MGAPEKKFLLIRETAEELASPGSLPNEEYCTGQEAPKSISTLSAYSLDRSYGSRHPKHRFSDPVISGCYHELRFVQLSRDNKRSKPQRT